MHSPNPKNVVAVMASFFLVSCAALVPEPAKILPPVELLQECTAPVGDTSTNGGLARYIRALRFALKLCNEDKAALREWADQ